MFAQIHCTLQTIYMQNLKLLKILKINLSDKNANVSNKV